MGMLDKFGFGTKEKTPFKIPWEVQALRARIDAENKENFPSLAHYREIARDADPVCQLLNQIVAQKEYAEEAVRLRDEIRAKLGGLGEKIKRNLQAVQKDVKADVARNIDHPERKSDRSMGILDKFGIGTKEKTPFKVPREVQELRATIDTENKENFPSLAHYREIASEADRVYELLNQIVVEKEHADEAVRIRDEIRAKQDGLKEKIKRNLQDARKEVKEDYVVRNIDYLERKSYRNKAKTLFTVFLENSASFERYCKEGSVEAGKNIESVSAELCQAAADLQMGFFRKYEEDREIRAIREDMMKKISEIRVLYTQNKQRFSQKELESIIESQLKLMPGEKELSR